jgi:hypothetical protein
VRPPVVAALARILKVPEAVLEMGQRTAPNASFRLAHMDLAFHREAPAAAPPPAVDAPEAAPRVPEIDDLFTGGG